jgi:hypothetical protein
MRRTLTKPSCHGYRPEEPATLMTHLRHGRSSNWVYRGGTDAR